MLRRSGSVVFTCVIGLWSSPSYGFRSGPPSGANGSTASFGNTCRACHGNASGLGSVRIDGMPAQYAPDTLYDLEVRVSDPNKLGAGFQFSIEDATGTHQGTLILNPTQELYTQHNGGWVNHRAVGVNESVVNWVDGGGSYAYTLSWQSPPADVGPLTFWAAGNAINNNFSNSGDVIYLTNTTISFTPGTGPSAMIPPESARMD
jgi:hypothetical protein